ncbi:Core-2/I-Branching enzyme [Proteus vulgaris]|nr:Core-2/I-Branching enzyme [Proteus vulgaris]
MGFSQVEASINLMKEAIKNKKYKYFSLISGVDFPIQNLSKFHNFLERNNDKEYISFWELKDRPDWLHKIQYYYPIDLIEIRNWKKNIFRLSFWGTFFTIRKLFPKRKFLPGLIPFGGSSWWTLTNNAIEYILSVYKERKDIIKYYKYTHAPDEMFFQTILLNSKYKNKVFMINEYNEWQSKIENTFMLDEKLFNLRYIDWSGRENQYPVILDQRDYQTLIDSNCFFARKLSEDKSILLVEMLKKHVDSSN